jgi:hypothetical protein
MRKPCRKVRHKDKTSAIITMKKQRNTRLDVFFCVECKAWHLGNSSSGFRKLDRINQLLNRVLPVAGQRGT